jgi:hypothetical protein
MQKINLPLNKFAKRKRTQSQNFVRFSDQERGQGFYSSNRMLKSKTFFVFETVSSQSKIFFRSKLQHFETDESIQFRYNARCLIGSRNIESAAYWNQILLVPYYIEAFNSTRWLIKSFGYTYTFFLA